MSKQIGSLKLPSVFQVHELFHKRKPFTLVVEGLIEHLEIEQKEFTNDEFLSFAGLPTAEAKIILRYSDNMRLVVKLTPMEINLCDQQKT